MKNKSLYSFIVFGALFFIGQQSFAQKLLLENNVSLTTYKLGYLRHVWITDDNNSKHEFGAYIKKVKLDTLYFIGGNKIALADINSIRFTPRNLFTKVGKPLIYSLAIFVTTIVATTSQVTDYSYTIEDRFAMFRSGIVYSSFLIELGGTGFWLITPKRELRRGINLAILNK